MQRFHAARRLRWQVYRQRLAGRLPSYVRSCILEPLEDEHRAALAAGCEDLEELALQDPPAPPLVAMTGAAGSTAPIPPSAWLVVHSGPAAEIQDLIGYAADLRRQEGGDSPLVLISPARPSDLPAGVAHWDLYPAWPLFPTAARIVSACGFNAMRQTVSCRSRHHFLPFPRPLDDQFERAARRRGATADLSRAQPPKDSVAPPTNRDRAIDR
jgi:hypothetical protein